MIYTVASVLLLFTIGFPRLAGFPRRYLLWGSLLFVAYELCLALSIGYANSSRQAIEVGMVNYLWPSFTMLFAIAFNGQKSILLIVPGLLLSVFGIYWVLGSDQGLEFPGMVEKHQDQPTELWIDLCRSLDLGSILHGDRKDRRREERHHAVLHADGIGAMGQIPGGRRGGNGIQLPGHRLSRAGRFGNGLWLCGLEYRHPARQCDRPCGSVVFHPSVFRRPGSAALARTTFDLLLARRIHGLRGIDAVLVGDACLTVEAINSGPSQGKSVMGRIRPSARLRISARPAPAGPNGSAHVAFRFRAAGA